MAILVSSLSILFLTFALGQISRITIMPGVAVTAQDIVVALFALFGIALFVVKKKFVISSVIKSFCLFVVVLITSLVVNIPSLPQTQFIGAGLYLLRFIVYGSLFFIISSFSTQGKKITMYAMTIGGMLVVMIGYIQFFLYPSLRNLEYAGWDEHLYRMFGSFFDPNFLGLFFVLFSLFLMYRLQRSRIAAGKYLYGICLALTIGGIYLTYSRSALLALSIGGITALFFQGKKSLVGVFIAAVIVAGIFTFSVSGKRSEGTNFLRMISAEARFTSAIEGLSIWQHHPLLGVGFNTYRYAQYRNGFVSTHDWEISHAAAGTDNSFVFIGATTGIVGFLAYLYFFYTHLHVLLSKKDRMDISLGIGTLIAVSIGSFFINALFYPAIMLWLWIVLAITEST